MRNLKFGMDWLSIHAKILPRDKIRSLRYKYLKVKLYGKIKWTTRSRKRVSKSLQVM